MRRAGVRASIPAVTGSIPVRQEESRGERDHARAVRHEVAARDGRLRRRVAGVLRGASTREERALDDVLRKRGAVSHANVIAVVSPKGGVGKTTCAFVLGNLLAIQPGLRCVVLDADSDLGTLAALVPGESRVPRTIADIFAEMDEVDSAVDLRPFVSALPTGLHVIAAHPRPEVMDAVTPELHSLLLDFLARFYDVIVVDMGTAMTGARAEHALDQADQSVLVSTPDFVAVSSVLEATRYVYGRPVTLVLNQAPRRPGPAARREIEQQLRDQGIDRHVILPYDDRLRAMLDSASYSLDSLDRDTRLAIKELGLATLDRLA